MNMWRASVWLLLVQPMSVASSSTMSLDNPALCYLLDGILIIYCLVATGLFFREKYCKRSAQASTINGSHNGIYQELERPSDTDPYQVLEASKGRVRGFKKRAPQPPPTQERGPTEPSPPAHQ